MPSALTRVSFATDYVTKPFSKLELVARIKTQLRLATTWRARFILRFLRCCFAVWVTSGPSDDGHLSLQLEVEREKTDGFLQKLLPDSIVSRLKGGQSVIADY